MDWTWFPTLRLIGGMKRREGWILLYNYPMHLTFWYKLMAQEQLFEMLIRLFVTRTLKKYCLQQYIK